MDPIKINKDEILFLKTDLLLHPREIEKIRNDIIRQIEGGAVIIPTPFTYTICKAKKRFIDADVWIEKLRNITEDQSAPGEYVDYCLHLIGEIESEIAAQEHESEG